MTVDIDSKAFTTGLEKAYSRLKLNTRKDVEDLADRALTEMRSGAPVRTGRAKATLGKESGRDAQGDYVDVGVLDRKGFYLRYAEYGTTKQPARPFIRPALAKGASSVRYRGFR